MNSRTFEEEVIIREKVLHRGDITWYGLPLGEVGKRLKYYILTGREYWFLNNRPNFK